MLRMLSLVLLYPISTTSAKFRCLFLATAGNGKALVVGVLAAMVLILAVRRQRCGAVWCWLLPPESIPCIGLAVCNLSFGYMLVLTNLIMPLFSPRIFRSDS